MDLADRIERLMPARRALLLQLLQQQRVVRQEKIPPRPNLDVAPPSFSQERIWFLEQLHPGSTVYNMPAVMPMKRPIRVEDLNRALVRLAERHEILRTTIENVDGKPLQLISAQARVRAEAVDLRRMDGEVRDAACATTMASTIGRPFDLAAAPPWRACLIHCSGDRQYLVLCLHHILADGWALDILFRDLSRICDSLLEGVPAELPPLSIQFGDFAHWQRRHINGFSHSIGYWREKLKDMPALLELPGDHARPAVQSFRGAVLSFTLPAELSDAIDAFARRAGLVPFMVLLAAFKVLLARLSGSTDIVVGTPVANRTSGQTEDLIGLFMNVLVLRTSLAGRPTFHELLTRIRTVCVEAYAHQELPFERLVAEMSPQRSLSYSPLFQVMFALQMPEQMALAKGASAGQNAGAEGDEPFANFDLRLATARTDLTFAMVRRNLAYEGSVEFSTDLFDRVTIARMVEKFKSIVAAVIADPERRIGDLPMVEEATLRGFNATARDYPAGTLPGFIATQAARTPLAVAVEFGGGGLTFAELDARAERLCRRLRSARIGHGDVVAICLSRSLELMVALLGTLKSGAAYLPVDPDTPRRRLAFMVEDARPSAVIGALGSEGALPEPLRAVKIVIDMLASASDPPDEPVPAAVCDGPREDDVAYVIFTSGSTGRPKGVMITHRAVCNRLLWMIEEFGFGPGDCIAQKTPITFDVSVWELFAPLFCGARLAIMAPGAHRDPGEIVRFTRARGVTVLHFVPSMLRAFLAAPDVESCRSLRHVVCSGEALSADLAQAFFKRSQAALANLYGPTEAAIDITYWRCQRDWSDPVIPIGRPVANSQAYILDDNGLPVAVGVGGELQLGGVQIALGYIGQPELTAERFLVDPFSDRPQARLYRTGDLARYRPDGAIEYLGRIDFQVKIRGFRIELGEIEAALRRHPGLRDAVAVLSGDGDAELAAFVVPEGEPPAVGELRAFLTEFLPEYAIPARVTVLDALPLTASGKVDRRALPRPAPLTGARGFSPPTTAKETVLAEIWREVLHAEQFGVDDDFFELGGHSLLAAQVLARLYNRFGTELPLRRLFELRTIRRIAYALDQEMIGGGGALEPRALTAERARRLLERLEELSPDEVAHWLLRLLDENEPTDPRSAASVTAGLSRDLLGRLDTLLDVEVDAALVALLPTLDATEWASLETTVAGPRVECLSDRRAVEARVAPNGMANGRSAGDAASFVGAFADFVFSVSQPPRPAEAEDRAVPPGTRPGTNLAAAWAAFVGDYRQVWATADAAALDPYTVAVAGQHLVAAAQLLTSFAQLSALGPEIR